MESGAAAADSGTNSNISAVNYAAVAALTNCTSGSPGSNETLTCLRKLPMETLLNATLTFAYEKYAPYGFDSL